MLRRINDLPANILGFDARGEITGDDYQAVLIPTLDEMVAGGKRVRFLYHLGPAFTGFETRALWDDAKVSFRHVTTVERIAVVTDVAWIRASVHTFGFFMHGRARVFANNKMAEARNWLIDWPLPFGKRPPHSAPHILARINSNCRASSCLPTRW